MFSLNSSNTHYLNLENWMVLSELSSDWSIIDGVLHMQVQEGNIWGGWYQEVSNTFIYPHVSGNYSAAVNVTLVPKLSFEQAGLGIYWDNTNYIKISKEMFDGKLSLVFVTEENGNPRINQRIDYLSESAYIKLEKADNMVTAFYRENAQTSWLKIMSVEALKGQEKGLMLYTFSGDKQQPNQAMFKDLTIEG